MAKAAVQTVLIDVIYLRNADYRLYRMMNLSARLDRIEALATSRSSAVGPVFIEPRACADREAFAHACQAAAGDAPCIVILPENGREATASIAVSALYLQRPAAR